MILQSSERLEDLAPSWNKYHNIAKWICQGNCNASIIRRLRMRRLSLRIHHHSCNPRIRHHPLLLCLQFHLTLMDLEVEYSTTAVDVHMALTLPISRTLPKHQEGDP